MRRLLPATATRVSATAATVASSPLTRNGIVCVAELTAPAGKTMFCVARAWEIRSTFSPSDANFCCDSSMKIRSSWTPTRSILATFFSFSRRWRAAST